MEPTLVFIMNCSTVAVLLCGLLLSIPAVTQQNPQKGQPQPALAGQAAPQAGGQPVPAGGQTVPQTAGQPQPPAAPQAPQPGRPTFTTTLKEVILPVTVTDNKGRFVSDLAQNDFRILDEGRPQRITYFYHDTPGTRQNTVIGFLVDMSSSNRVHWDKFKEATKQLIWGLLPNDPNYQGYLISYKTEAEVNMDTTADPDKLTDQVDRLQPGGGAALYNAIYKACTDRKLVPGEPYQPRRVIIVIGDGHDTASEYTLDQVIELAQRNQVTIFGVSTLAFGASNDDEANLERMTHETGGHVEYPLASPYSSTVSGYLSNPSDDGNYALTVGSGGYTAAIASAISNSVQALEGEITTQYILRYIPEIDPATAYKDKRRIEVKILPLPPGSVKVQARQYYYSDIVKQQ
jgi:VWFA-related protein